jgi:lysophospholipase L1-like esterase
MRFLALGDSYTIGERVAKNERWPVQLAARLRAHGVPITDPEIIAVTGWTTDELDAGIQAAQPQGPYDLVSLLIGVNNQYRGRSPEEYQAQFADLLQQAIGLAGGDPTRVIVLSIPDWGVTPFAANETRLQSPRRLMLSTPSTALKQKRPGRIMWM